MSTALDPQKQIDIQIPEISVCTLAPRVAHIFTVEGEVKSLSHGQAGVWLAQKSVLLCHAPYTLSKLRTTLHAFDILDLFLFVHPTRFCVPTVFGVGKALQIHIPETTEDMPLVLSEAVQVLLKDFQDMPSKTQKKMLEIAQIMGMNGKGWAWTPFLFSAVGQDYDPQGALNSRVALNVWKARSEWTESAPVPAASHQGVSAQETEIALNDILKSDHTHEERPEQMAYTQSIRTIFEPTEEEGAPHFLIAEAGTGTGKTLGYLTPSTLWAKKNEGAVWISTYTKNLQQQIDQELSRIYTTPEIKDKKVVIRKGRENYLCLLNLEEASASAHLSRSPSHPITLGIMARWVMETRTGDFTGTDFPSWAQSLYGYANTTGLSDKRGECLYSACDHYTRCFRETSVRRAPQADIVIANHALVMIQTAHNDQNLPTRAIFDEGHHLFQAADSAFAVHLTARETNELRRWVLGHEDTRKKRARGLQKRFEDLISDNEDIKKSLGDLLHRARQLPAEGWSARLAEGAPTGSTELFLSAVLAQIRARTQETQVYYAQETDIFPLTTQVQQTLAPLIKDMKALKKPMVALSKAMYAVLEQEDNDLESDARRRIDSLAQSIERRAVTQIKPWIEMLISLQTEDIPSQFSDWMEIEKKEGRAFDIGLYRHWIDPMKPFATAIVPHVHGLAITSATLKGREDERWDTAKMLTGADYISETPLFFETDSPFDYKTQSKVIIINDVNKNNRAQVSSAYLALFKASKGGGLGLFTAIQRLKAVYEDIHEKLSAKDIPLYAQHIDQIDTGTLTDMFREDITSCLLGTDALRDGVDVPGESLKLMIFDRVPWPRPTLLHKARRKSFGGKTYDEMLARMKLQQAFGRLIRKKDDKGIFVILDGATPTKLLSAFPKDIEIERVGLQEALKRVKEV